MIPVSGCVLLFHVSRMGCSPQPQASQNLTRIARRKRTDYAESAPAPNARSTSGACSGKPLGASRDQYFLGESVLGSCLPPFAPGTTGGIDGCTSMRCSTAAPEPPAQAAHE